MILSPNDPVIPSSQRASKGKRNIIPVRFFGTYDFAWVQAGGKNLLDFMQHVGSKGKGKSEPLVRAVKEARAHAQHGALPIEFDYPVSPRIISNMT